MKSCVAAMMGRGNELPGTVCKANCTPEAKPNQRTRMGRRDLPCDVCDTRSENKARLGRRDLPGDVCVNAGAKTKQTGRATLRYQSEAIVAAEGRATLPYQSEAEIRPQANRTLQRGIDC